MKILEEKIADQLWKKIYNDFCFTSSCTKEKYCWINLPEPHKKYLLQNVWNKEEEKLVNSFFEELAEGDLFALNWQHDSFVFSPKEHIPANFEFYDESRNCNVYFPTYYPDGDYYFFFDRDYKIALFGHPWLKEIIVLGKELIQKFDSHLNELKIVESC